MLLDIQENRLLEQWAKHLPRSPQSIGSIHESDAELIQLTETSILALTTDTIAEEIQLGLYRDPSTAGRIAVTAGLSDLAAVGALPLGMLVAVTLPKQNTSTVQEQVALGFRDACSENGTWILGGDTNVDDRLSITATAVGMLNGPRPLQRIGIRSGDHIFISGPMGLGAALAATVFLRLPQGWFNEEDYRPAPCIAHGRALCGIASACIDTSDGLIAALDQLSRLNAVAMQVDVPLQSLLHPKAEKMRRSLELPAFAFVAAEHGDYQLLFTVPSDRLPGLASVAATTGWKPQHIGIVKPGAGVYLGSTFLESAAIRNLWTTVDHDPQRYLDALLRTHPQD